ncbi:hypothetical protein [Limosilactobacillus oris]|uniref:hypothetical protein n=1 Tax=Limosilactobacillus oris TaxID=1632 RepID=UPI003208721F
MTSLATEVSDHFDRLLDKCFFNGARPGFIEDSGDKPLGPVIKPFVVRYTKDIDYQAILKFRKIMEINEYKKHKLAVKKLGELMDELPQSKEFKAARLREMGLNRMDICCALDETTSWFDNHARKLVDKEVDEGYDLKGAVFDIENRLMLRRMKNERVRCSNNVNREGEESCAKAQSF